MIIMMRVIIMTMIDDIYDDDDDNEIKFEKNKTYKILIKCLKVGIRQFDFFFFSSDANIIGT